VPATRTTEHTPRPAAGRGVRAPTAGAIAAVAAFGAAILAALVAADVAAARAPSAPATGPQRVVTLAPHLTELVYAAGAGDRLVGTVDTSDWPEAARRVPRIGDVARLDAERLLAARPDLVIAWADGTPAEQRALLDRLRLDVLPMSQATLADVPAAIERLGRLFGTAAVADANAARLRAELAALRARHARATPLAVFYQVWDPPLYTLGGTQVATEMLAVCGARNVYADQRVSALAIDVESVYARDPDVIVLAGSPREAAEWRARWSERPRLRAEFVTLDPDLANRMGPRVVAGTAELCGKLDAVRAAGRPTERTGSR
jgi:iron complex transport system substrate-binding protein